MRREEVRRKPISVGAVGGSRGQSKADIRPELLKQVKIRPNTQKGTEMANIAMEGRVMERKSVFHRRMLKPYS